MLFGPVFHSELIMTARRKRYYAARVLYGFFLLFSLWQQFEAWHQMEQMRRERGFAPTESLKAMARFAESAFVGFAWAQGVAILCLVPPLLAGVIADEHQRKTLHYLLGSELSSAGIVLGKLAARMLHVGVLLLIGVPVVCMVGLFGGLDPWEVGYVYAGTLSLTLFIAGLAMLISVVANRPRDAILTTYLLEAGWLFLPPLIASVDTYFGGLAWIPEINKFVLMVNPLNAWRLVTETSWNNQARSLYSARGMIPTGMSVGVLERYVTTVGIQTVLGLLFLFLAIVALRPLKGGGGRWERRRTVWFPSLRALAARFRAHPECGDEPMIWKERFTAGGGALGWLSSRPIVLMVAVVLGAFVIEAAQPAFREFMYGMTESIVAADLNRIYLNGVIREWTVGLYILLLLSVASASAVSVTSEREQDSWTSLTASLLSGSEIVLGKIRGAIWSGRRLIWVMIGLGAVGLVSGSIHPLGALAAAIGLGLFIWFTASLGVYISLRAKSSTRALAATVFWLLVFNGGYLIPLSAIAKTSALYGAGVTPFVVHASLLSYRDFRVLWGSEMNPAAVPGSTQPELLVAYLIALLVYGVGALLITGAACEAYEKVVDRPRRGV